MTIPIRYFPDTSMLVLYLRKQDSEYQFAECILKNTCQTGPLIGYLLDSVKDEFDGITSNKHLEDATTYIAEKTSKVTSIDKLTETIKRIGISYPSQDILIEELQFRAKNTKGLTSIKIQQLIQEVIVDIKMNRDGALRKLISENQKHAKKDQNKTELFDEIDTKLGLLFPIRPNAQKNDKKDNDHIRNAAIFCFNESFDGWFVTCDWLRRPKEFEAKANELKQLLSNKHISFNLTKTDKFIIEVKRSEPSLTLL